MAGAGVAWSMLSARGHVVEEDVHLALLHLAQRAAVSFLDADRACSLLQEAQLDHDQNAVSNACRQARFRSRRSTRYKYRTKRICKAKNACCQPAISSSTDSPSPYPTVREVRPHPPRHVKCGCSVNIPYQLRWRSGCLKGMGSVGHPWKCKRRLRQASDDRSKGAVLPRPGHPRA